MAITLGSFTKLDDGIFLGTLKTLNVSAALTVVPVDKMSDNAPDYRVYAGLRYEIGADWSQIAKSSGGTYVDLKLAAPEFGADWVRCRLVKLDGRRRTAPRTSCCENRATANRCRPRRGHLGGASLPVRPTEASACNLRGLRLSSCQGGPIDRTVDVTIPVEPEAAAALTDARNRGSVAWSAACCARALAQARWRGLSRN